MWPGTGPYIAESVTPTQIDLVKNDNYWGGEAQRGPGDR